jgi:hypothetical protein
MFYFAGFGYPGHGGMFGPLLHGHWFDPAAAYIAYNWDALRATANTQLPPFKQNPSSDPFKQNEFFLPNNLLPPAMFPPPHQNPLPCPPPVPTRLQTPLSPQTSNGSESDPRRSPSPPQRKKQKEETETKSAFQQVKPKKGTLTSSAPSKGVWRPY